MEIYTEIQELQQELDVPPYLMGSQIFFEAIQILTEDLTTPVTKGVYGALAEQYGVSWKAICSRLAGVMNYIWENCEVEKYGFSRTGPQPTPRPFLCKFAVYINKKRKE